MIGTTAFVKIYQQNLLSIKFIHHLNLSMLEFYIRAFLLLSLSTYILHATSLSWDKTEVDMEMEPDQKEAHACFTVTNISDQTLRIKDIKTSCGCTQSIIKGKILEPGAKSEIIGIFNKGKRRGKNINKLRVYIEGFSEPVATLSMNVYIPSLISAKPEIVYWSKNNKRSSRRILISLDERYIDNITGIDYENSRLSILEEPGEQDSGIERVLIVKPRNYDSPYRGNIIVYGSGPGGRKADIHLHAFVQP